MCSICTCTLHRKYMFYVTCSLVEVSKSVSHICSDAFSSIQSPWPYSSIQIAILSHPMAFLVAMVTEGALFCQWMVQFTTGRICFSLTLTHLPVLLVFFHTPLSLSEEHAYRIAEKNWLLVNRQYGQAWQSCSPMLTRTLLHTRSNYMVNCRSNSYIIEYWCMNRIIISLKILCS